MNQKELSELRRRFRPERSAVSRVYGCYVNGSGEIISDLDESLGAMPQEEAEKYLGLLKKALSGTLGKNLIDIVFSTQQVMDSPEHRLLTGLRDSALKDGALRQDFYRKVIDALDMGGNNYLILLAHDVYDVPYRSRDDQDQADASDQVFSYLVCCVCPVKEGKPELGYFPGENEFHSCSAGQVVSPPELGFLFPAFDDRCANLYDVLYYTKNPAETHPELIDAVFRQEAPMSAEEQKDTFRSVLCETLSEDCSLDVIQGVHTQLREKIEEHKASKTPEPLTVSRGEVREMLETCGVAPEHLTAFDEKYEEEFGGDTDLSPRNLIDVRQFEVRTPDVVIKVNPDRSDLIQTRIIDGVKYLLIRADGGVEVNGANIHISNEDPQ